MREPHSEEIVGGTIEGEVEVDRDSATGGPCAFYAVRGVWFSFRSRS